MSAPPPSYNQQGGYGYAPPPNSGQPTYQQQYGQQPQPGYAPPPNSGQPMYQQQYGQQPGYGYAPAPPQPQSDLENDPVFNADSFSEKAIRHQFIRKVYLILMAQLLFTFSIVAIFVFVDSVNNWVRRNLWFYILSYVTFLVTYIVLACCPGVRRKYPGNYIALGVFTVSFTYVCATIASFHQADAVLIAAGITAAVTLGISLFACQTKIDFTMCSGLIFAASLVLILVGFLYILIAFAIPPGPKGINYYYLQCCYGGIAALILSLFLVFDTQMIVGGKKRKYQLSPEEHIVGAMELYLDIVYLFLIILSFFGGGRD